MDKTVIRSLKRTKHKTQDEIKRKKKLTTENHPPEFRANNGAKRILLKITDRCTFYTYKRMRAKHMQKMNLNEYRTKFN